MPLVRPRSILRDMRSYPVAWWEASETTSVGRLVVHAGHLALDGRSRDDASTSELSLSFDELSSVRVVRTPPDRVDGRPALVVSRSAGRAVTIVGLGGLAGRRDGDGH